MFVLRKRGPPRSTYFTYTTRFRSIPNCDIDDLSVVSVRFANGAVANITSACMLQSWGRVKLEVFCRGLVVEVDGGSININRAGGIESLGNDVHGYFHEDRVFNDPVKSADASKIRSTYNDALNTFRIMIAASKSCVQGKQIDL